MSESDASENRLLKTTMAAPKVVSIDAIGSVISELSLTVVI